MENISKKKFCVEGMTCSACSSHVEKDVSKLDGVKKVEVSLMTNSMVVEYDNSKTSISDIIAAVDSGGYKGSIYKKNKIIDEKNSQEVKKKKRRGQ